MIQNDTSYLRALLLACCVCSCELDADGEGHAPPAPAPARAPEASPRPVRVRPPAKAKLEARAAELEGTGLTPSAEMVAKISALNQHLDRLVSHSEGSRIAFVDCQGSACGARLSASNLGQLQDMLRGISQDQQGRVGFVVRERLDPYLGRSFEADLALDTDDGRPVPEDVAELLQRPGE